MRNVEKKRIHDSKIYKSKKKIERELKYPYLGEAKVNPKQTQKRI